MCDNNEIFTLILLAQFWVRYDDTTLTCRLVVTGLRSVLPRHSRSPRMTVKVGRLTFQLAQVAERWPKRNGMASGRCFSKK